jgi:hypothetical protein
MTNESADSARRRVKANTPSIVLFLSQRSLYTALVSTTASANGNRRANRWTWPGVLQQPRTLAEGIEPRITPNRAVGRRTPWRKATVRHIGR